VAVLFVFETSSFIAQVSRSYTVSYLLIDYHIYQFVPICSRTFLQVPAAPL
jgi:hypothetical protein